MKNFFKEEDVDKELEMYSEKLTRFHFFRLHDQDSNDKLDGLEIMAAMSHFSEHETEGNTESVMSQERINEMVDSVLAQEDADDDGFVDYYEFIKAQEAAMREAAMRAGTFY